MSVTYRDDRDAALARAEALHRENELLRAENSWLRAQIDPAGADGVHWVRGALIALALLLSTTVGASMILRDMAAHAPLSTTPFELSDQAFSDEALRRALTSAAPVPALVAPASVVAPSAGDAPRPGVASASTAALAPRLQECFVGPRRRVHVVATMDARGHARRVHVVRHGGARAPRAEHRCVRRVLNALELPFEHGDFVSRGPAAEVHLVLLPTRGARGLTRGG